MAPERPACGLRAHLARVSGEDFIPCPSRKLGPSDWQFLPTVSKEEEAIQFSDGKNHINVLTTYHLCVFFMQGKYSNIAFSQTPKLQGKVGHSTKIMAEWVGVEGFFLNLIPSEYILWIRC